METKPLCGARADGGLGFVTCMRPAGHEGEHSTRPDRNGERYGGQFDEADRLWATMSRAPEARERLTALFFGPEIDASRIVTPRPFGFTDEDVDLCLNRLHHPDDPEFWVKLTDLGQRIARILHPNAQKEGDA